MADKAALNRAVRHQVLLEQYSAGQVKRMQKILKSTADSLSARILKEGQTIENTRRYKALLKDTRALLNASYGGIGDGLIEELEKLAPQEAAFASKSLQLQVNVQTTLPTAEQLNVAVFARPVEGQFLRPFIKTWEIQETRRVANAITEGFYRGTTTANIAREIRGTQANQFKDGIIGGVTNRNASTMVRTAINHTSNQARMATLGANSDIVQGWSFVNTLDDRTSVICAGQSTTKVWDIGRGPLPPLHPNCRSTIVFVPKKQFEVKPTRGSTTRASVGADGPKPVPATQTYSTWLKNQPAAFQDQALGKSRGALFRRGDLTIDKFTTNTNNILTLDELRGKYPMAFDKANL
jgi:SPP1 gp7 family putative phage head morphogenesis protein